MALDNALSGTWTWNGTTIVASTDTSGIQSGDFIRMSSMSGLFEIQSVNPDTSVTVLNPHSLAIPSGIGAFKNDENVKSAILAAGDVACAETWEDITEPSIPPGTKRITRRDYTSATVHPTKTYRVDISYVHPANDPAWGAIAGIEESIV